MKKSVFIMISFILVQCLFLSGCHSLDKKGNKTVVTEMETSSEETTSEKETAETEPATEYVIIEGESLEDILPPKSFSESAEKNEETNTKQNAEQGSENSIGSPEGSGQETQQASEPNEYIPEPDAYGFIPGENETPGDPL